MYTLVQIAYSKLYMCLGRGTWEVLVEGQYHVKECVRDSLILVLW